VGRRQVIFDYLFAGKGSQTWSLRPTSAVWHALSEISRLLDVVPGIGKIIASVISASVPDPNVFKTGRDFAA
jgi:transposase